MYADFFGAGANHGHWLPIAWLKAALNGAPAILYKILYIWQPYTSGRGRIFRKLVLGR